MTYRRNIWEMNPEYTLHADETAIDYRLVGFIKSFEAIKRRASPIPAKRLIELAEKLKTHPDFHLLNDKKFAIYLRSLCVFGVSLQTAVNMLAISSDGDFPPMDVVLATGLLSLNLIDSSEAEILAGANADRFATVYINKIMPLWREARAAGETVIQIDKRWSEACSAIA